MSTGIVRRIDELGRIVVPKEIRKNLRLKNGDNLEIVVEGENIILKKKPPCHAIKHNRAVSLPAAAVTG